MYSMLTCGFSAIDFKLVKLFTFFEPKDLNNSAWNGSTAKTRSIFLKTFLANPLPNPRQNLDDFLDIWEDAKIKGIFLTDDL